MTPDPAIVVDLRKLFLAGATPSRLIRFIASHHAGDANWPRYVSTYFWAAFSVVIPRVESKLQNDHFETADFSHYNEDELHEIVVRAKEWHTNSTPEEDSLPAWFENLEVQDDFTTATAMHPEVHPSLVDCWPSMDEKARKFVRQSMINAQAYYERMRIIAKLAEQLQHQVIDLENRANCTVSAE
jgi:Cdc6-like AAA superfamily ATPase